MPDLYIDGRWTAGSTGETSPVVAPFDGRVLTEVDVASDDDVQRAIAAARRVFDEGDWSATPAPDRGALLDRIGDLLQGDLEEIARAETSNTGKALREGRYDVEKTLRMFEEANTFSLGG